jgi:Cupin-like domain
LTWRSGRRWLLLPPEHTHLAMDPHGHALAPSLDPAEAPRWRRLYPRLDEAFAHSIEVVQRAGDALFVPSGWHHSVENVEDTASINHNWLNGYNVGAAVAHVLSTFARGRRLLDDCRCVQTR